MNQNRKQNPKLTTTRPPYQNGPKNQPQPEPQTNILMKHKGRSRLWCSQTHLKKKKKIQRGPTRDSGDEIFFPTVNDSEWEPEKLSTQDQESKATTWNTKDKEQSTNNLQTETLIQRFGIFERQEHRQNKLENWSLTPKKPIILLGDSNLTHLPKMKNEKVKIVSYPGAKLEHIFHILKNKTNMAPEVHVIVLYFGINNREITKNRGKSKRSSTNKVPDSSNLLPLN